MSGAEPGVLAVGSNLGDRLAHLRRAVEVVRAGPGLRAASPVYETVPVGGPAQGDYLNAVLLTGPGRPEELLAAARAAEGAAGRVRGVRFGPRTLDVDVIAVGDTRRDDPELRLPHPRAHQRAFVLLPWFDVEPDAVLPGHGAVRDLLDGLDLAGVRRCPGLRLVG